MASRKDMRRDDLVVAFEDVDKDKESGDFASTMTSTMPMAAIFTRNKMLAWTAMMFALQQWMAETPASRAKSNGSPAIFSIGMALMAVGVSYMPLFMPPQPGRGGATGAGPPVPLPS